MNKNLIINSFLSHPKKKNSRNNFGTLIKKLTILNSFFFIF